MGRCPWCNTEAFAHVYVDVGSMVWATTISSLLITAFVLVLLVSRDADSEHDVGSSRAGRDAGVHALPFPILGAFRRFDFNHFNFTRWVPITKFGHIHHLCGRDAKQCIPLVVLELQNVKNTFDRAASKLYMRFVVSFVSMRA